MTSRRGLLIVLEGCDRSGKSTLSRRLVQDLSSVHSLPSQPMCFPDRSTQVGQVLDAYLKGKKQLNDQAVHLLFSTNRWEKADEIKAAASIWSLTGEQ